MATRLSPPGVPGAGAVAVGWAEDDGGATANAVVLGGVAGGCADAPPGGTGELPGKTIGSGAPVAPGRPLDKAGAGTVGTRLAAGPGGGESGGGASANCRGSGLGAGGGPDLLLAVDSGSAPDEVGLGVAPGDVAGLGAGEGLSSAGTAVTRSGRDRSPVDR